MITINKQCVDDYTTYNQLKKKLETLENSLAYINQKEPDITWFIHHMELQRLKIISLYTDNKELIDKTLYEEVKRLKQEISKYTIE